MANISLPYSMEQDRINKVKANSVHVDANFNTLLQAVNNKLGKDGSTVPSADLPMGNHKIIGLATPENSGDATTKGYVDALITELRASIVAVQSKADTNANTIVNNLEIMYPVGSVYIGTQTECPMSILIENSVWQLVSSGRALWTGDGSNGASTIEAGLPNITATVAAARRGGNTATTGAMYWNGASSSKAGDSGGNVSWNDQLNFNASRSNSLYGNSTTVQPPAYVVNVWRRTA